MNVLTSVAGPMPKIWNAPTASAAGGSAVVIQRQLMAQKSPSHTAERHGEIAVFFTVEAADRRCRGCIPLQQA